MSQTQVFYFILFFYPNQWLTKGTRKTWDFMAQVELRLSVGVFSYLEEGANARASRVSPMSRPRGKSLKERFMRSGDRGALEGREGPCPTSCIEGRSELNIHYYSPSPGNDLHAVCALEKTSLKNCLELDLKIFFIFKLIKWGWFCPYRYTTDKKETHSEFYSWKRSLRLQTKLTNSFGKIITFTYISFLILFLNSGRRGSQGSQRVLVLFYSWQLFLIFENLNPISCLKLKTELTWSFLEGNLVELSRILNMRVIWPCNFASGIHHTEILGQMFHKISTRILLQHWL